MARAERAVRKRALSANEVPSAELQQLDLVDLLSDEEEEQPAQRGKTERQLAAEAKRKAQKDERKEKAEQKKQEQFAKREQTKANRQIVALAGKAAGLLQPLCEEMAAVLKSKDELPGLLVENLVDSHTKLSEWRKASAGALQKHARNTEAALEPLPYETEKILQAELKDARKYVQTAKKTVKSAEKPGAKGKQK